MRMSDLLLEETNKTTGRTLGGFPVTQSYGAIPDAQEDDVDEALKIGDAKTKTIPTDVMQGRLNRIHDRNKTLTDKKKPIIHRSNLVATMSDDPNDRWDLNDLAQKIMTRPRQLIASNAKMKSSIIKGKEKLFDITLPALSGIVVDEQTYEFVEVNTCPAAGVCQKYCFARKGGYVMFPPSSMNAARTLNFLVNDPEGYFDRIARDLSALGVGRVTKKLQIIVRWHDSGDFFSMDYFQKAVDLAKKFPNIEFYAYTKSANVATNPDTPDNFIINFSDGAANKSTEMVQKHIDAGNHMKHARVIPKDVFDDLVLKDQEGKLVKDNLHRTQLRSPAAWDILKQRLAKRFNVDIDTIISYDEMLQIPKGKDPKWRVIVQTGAGDRAANRRDVIDSYLLIH